MYASKKSSSCPNKISPSLDRHIRWELKRDSSLTSNQITVNTDAEWSSWTIRQHLNKGLRTWNSWRGLTFFLTIKLPIYNLLLIIKLGMWINGRKCCFQMRKKFNLDDLAGFQHNWHAKNFPEEIFSTQTQ